MEQWIITVGGTKYLLKSDVPLTQEQIEYIISQSSVKTLSKTCISAATVGQTIKLENTIQSGTSPYNVSIKKDGSALQNWTATPLLTQTVNYTLVTTDVGIRRFSVDTSDSCSTGAKSTTEFCDVVVSDVTGVMSFSSSPYGAEIYIDNVDQLRTTGASPVNISVSSGVTHTWKLTLYGYNDATGSQLVTAGQTYTINPTLVQTGTNINLSVNGSGKVVAYKRLSTSDAWTKIGETTSTIVISYANLNLFRLEAFPDTGYNFKEYKNNFNYIIASTSVAEGTVSIDNTGLSLCTDRCYNTSTLTAYFGLISTTGSISFSSTPSGADIYLGGVSQSSKTPSTITNVTTGSYTWLLRLSGYMDATGNVIVTAGQTATVSATLTPTTGSISFISIPAGADIYIDGIKQSGITPLTITGISAGIHSWLLRLSGYNDATGTATVTAGQIATVSVTLTSVVTTGVLSFSSSPYGAEIYIDNVDQLKTTGASPVNISVSPGTHSWKLTLSGYNDATGSQLVTAGQTYTINPTLVQTATVCTWISAKGGWTAISAYNIMELVSGYSGATSLGFTVTAAHIMGAVAYYSDNLSSGNNLTGCGFT